MHSWRWHQESGDSLSVVLTSAQLWPCPNDPIVRVRRAASGASRPARHAARRALERRDSLHTAREARVVIEGWRQEYNEFRPHSAIG